MKAVQVVTCATVTGGLWRTTGVVCGWSDATVHTVRWWFDQSEDGREQLEDASGSRRPTSNPSGYLDKYWVVVLA